MSETIDFIFNKPVLVTLAFAEGRAVPSKYPGSTRTMRTTKDARVFFCNPQLEAKIKALNPAPGVTLEITKLEREGARSGHDWKVERVGEQRDGTYKIPKADSVSTPQCPEPASVMAPIQSTDQNKTITAVPARPVSEVESHCRRLVDLTRETRKYAQANGDGVVSPEDIRAIVLTVYIQAGRSGMLRKKPAQRVGAAAGERRIG